MTNRWFLDPIAGRGYPEDMRRGYGTEMEVVRGDDLNQIATPVDFMGLNHYFRNIARSREVTETNNQPTTARLNTETTEMSWEVYPKGMYEMLGQVHLGYGFPAIDITENAAAYPDEVDSDAQIEDAATISYLRRHLHKLLEAIGIGVPVRRYFVWSLLDNFEWAFGTSKRFGLIHVDFESQRRTPKASARWYREVIWKNAVIQG